MITAERLIKLLNLQPHPEGGYYAETYRSNELIPKEALLERYAGPRSYGCDLLPTDSLDVFRYSPIVDRRDIPLLPRRLGCANLVAARRFWTFGYTRQRCCKRDAVADRCVSRDLARSQTR